MRIPRVSICIPTYCQVDYLKETLRSVQAQEFDDYELIISDDTADDTVEKLVGSFGFDDRLRYFHNPVALGSPENWNAAVRKAQGNYIKLLHHDDRFSHPGALGAFVRLLDDNIEADFAFSASSAENVIDGCIHYQCPSKKQVIELGITPEKLFFKNIIGAPSATIYRNGLGIEYDRVLQWLVDVDFYIRFLKYNPLLIYSDEVLIVTATNAMHQITERCKNNVSIEMFEYIYIYQKIAQKISENIDVQYVWFRLFEKYQIYSQADLQQQGDRFFIEEKILQSFFESYRLVRLKRTPYRIYARLPETLKSIIRFFYYKVMPS